MSRERIDMVKAGLLPPIPSAFLDSQHLELLEPLEFASAGSVSSRPAPKVDRRELAEALGVANAGYGHPRAREQARKLADPETRVVVTGQQPGLLGGPLYSLSKAVAAARWVERLEEQGHKAVAVYWVATEDHDFREVSSSLFLSSDGPLSVSLGEDESELTPVGMRTLGPKMSAILEELKAANTGDRWSEWIDRLAAWYRPEARFGEAFNRLIVGLLGERCPLMLDSMLPALKSAQRPWLRRLVEERVEVDRAFNARAEAIEAAGFDLQVKPQPGASPLFFLRGQERRRVEWREGGRIGLRGEPDFDQSIDWLLSAIDDNPGVVSPGVMARTALQDATLGTSVLVFGPGEVSYIPQVAPLYALLGIQAPTVSLRPQAIVFARHQLDKLDALEIPLSEILAADFDIDRVASAGREESVVAPVRAEINSQLERLQGEAEKIDPNLATPMEKTRKQIDRALDAFTGRLASAVARGDEVRRQRLGDLRSNSRPLGTLQERALSTSHFPGKYGDHFVNALFEQLELQPRELQVIEL